jgi:hypothetical protein
MVASLPIPTPVNNNLTDPLHDWQTTLFWTSLCVSATDIMALHALGASFPLSFATDCRGFFFTELQTDLSDSLEGLNN